MTYLRLAIAGAGGLAATLYGIGIALLRRDRSRVAHDYARALARLTQRPLGIRLHVSGEENLYAERPCIYVANHQSNFDVPVLASVFPDSTVAVAKRELRRLPLFGWLLEVTGNIYIDRSDREQAVGSLRGVEEEIRRKGVSVWIFPEGTRGTRAGELLPFKKGAFQLAIGAGVPLVPVVVSPIEAVLDMEPRRIRPGTVEIRVLEPRATRGLGEDGVDELLRVARSRMATAYTELARRHLPAPREASAAEPSGG